MGRKDPYPQVIHTPRPHFPQKNPFSAFPCVLAQCLPGILVHKLSTVYWAMWITWRFGKFGKFDPRGQGFRVGRARVRGYRSARKPRLPGPQSAPMAPRRPRLPASSPPHRPSRTPSSPRKQPSSQKRPPGMRVLGVFCLRADQIFRREFPGKTQKTGQNASGYAPKHGVETKNRRIPEFETNAEFPVAARRRWSRNEGGVQVAPDASDRHFRGRPYTGLLRLGLRRSLSR